MTDTNETIPNLPSADGVGNMGGPIGARGVQITENELRNMSPAEINQARREGRLEAFGFGLRRAL